MLKCCLHTDGNIYILYNVPGNIFCAVLFTTRRIWFHLPPIYPQFGGTWEQGVIFMLRFNIQPCCCCCVSLHLLYVYMIIYLNLHYLWNKKLDINIMVSWLLVEFLIPCQKVLKGEMRLWASSPNPTCRRRGAIYDRLLGASQGWCLLSADPHATKQPYLGMHCLPQSGEGPRKGGLEKAHPYLLHRGGNRTSRGIPCVRS